MKKIFQSVFLFCFLFSALMLSSQNFQIPPDSLTNCYDSVPQFKEGGKNKINKLQNKVLPAVGVTDTANVSILLSTTKIYHYNEGDPIPEGAEIIPMGKYSVACIKGEPIYRVDHLLSKCIDLISLLEYYGYGPNIYYIQFQKDGKDLNTSFWKYATPLGNKKEMQLKYESN